MKERPSKSYVSIVLLCLCISFTIQAQEYSTSAGKLRHFVGLQTNVGEANTVPNSKEHLVQSKAGAAASLGFVYELSYRHWRFGIGLDGGYHYKNDYISSFTDAFPRLDRNGESVSYEYVYHQYAQQNHVLMLSLPLHVGYDIGQWVYIQIGGRISMPLVSQYKVHTNLYTQGVYPWSISPIRSDHGNDFSLLGYYPDQSLDYRSTYADYVRAGISFEAGGYLPLPQDAKRAIRLRMGVYATVDWRLGKSPHHTIADYTNVDTNPTTQTQENLWQTLSLHALTTTVAYASLPSVMECGIRLTCLFDATLEPKICRCANY